MGDKSQYLRMLDALDFHPEEEGSINAQQEPERSTREPTAQSTQKIQESIKKDRQSLAQEQRNRYQEYKGKVQSLLEQERKYEPCAERPSQACSTNLLQYVLENAPGFHPPNQKLHKTKFLLQLVTRLDPTQLSPKGTPKPLHAAARCDIELLSKDEASKPDLTIHVANLMKDKAADEICGTNENGENIIHLAIHHSFQNTIELIGKANKSAFSQQRVSKLSNQLDDGNTPLHDALDFKYFLMPWPCCAQPEFALLAYFLFSESPTNETSKLAAAAISSRLITKEHMALISKTAKQQCDTCKSSFRHNLFAWKERLRIVALLVDRDPDALMIHNSAGLSPYLYLGSGCDKFEKQQLQELMISSTNESETLDSEIVVNADTEDEKIITAATFEESVLKDKKREQEKKSQRGKSPSNRADLVQTLTDVQEVGNIGMNQPPRNQTGPHTAQDLVETNIGCKELLSWLKEVAFLLGSREKAYLCLFRDQKAQNAILFEGETNNRRTFFLAGPQRVQRDTTKTYDFLVFEPMMASITLSLEYSHEQLQKMPSTYNDRIEVWRKDGENLKAVFQWLKIRECLQDLEIRYLDWNRPDLCANHYTLPKTLVEIRLYWTGLNAVLWSWSDTEGLRTLERLQKVTLAVIRPARTLEIEDHVDEGQSGSNENSGDGTANVTPEPHTWIKAANTFSQDLYRFCSKTVNLDKPYYHIKVALLDNGVDPVYRGNWANLHSEGWPLVDSGEREEGLECFYFSTNQHGSKIASLIRRVCPFITIYIAKLDAKSSEDLRDRSFSLRQATEAIKWATKQGVDIISMSWNVHVVNGQAGNTRDIDELEAAVDGAAKAGILMFGAACDVKASSSSDRWMPCDSPNVYSIGATDVDYDPKKYVNMLKKVDYLFPGERVLDSHRKEDIQVGNSGATALAAGLAAMIMFCMKLEGQGIPRNKRIWIGNVMNLAFSSTRNSKSVRVINVLELDKKQGVKPLVRKFLDN
ncbi:hypothetical protein F4803DRAFT_573033 [Xylaria telfairii]|nr:hypothetical protein F4803DRAFT_573033 [Xylaria telfairii]